MFNKIKGGLFGVAVGDALGVTTEFLDPIQIKHLYGVHKEIIGGGVFGFEKGEVSDDTDMTLCVTRGILENPSMPYEAIGREFLKWHQSKPKDVGNTTDDVLKRFDGDWLSSAEISHRAMLGKSAGNGSLMRVLPASLAYTNLNTSIKVAYNQSKMTHYDNLASDACILYTKIAHHLLHGAFPLEAIKKEVIGTVYESVLYGEPKGNPDGYVINSLSWALYFLLSTKSFSELVISCVNAGHDADTTAAIAGGLGGIFYGYEGISPSYTSALLKKEEISLLAADLYELRKKDTY